MIILGDNNLAELTALMKENGAPAYRAEQLFKGICAGKELSEINVPKSLFDNEEYTATGVKILEKRTARDGTAKYLFALHDGNIVEGVLMSYKYGNTVCISTQAGCRMNCSFCASGISGLIRDLTSGEMLGEVVTINRDAAELLKGEGRAVTNIVLMGSGEPLDNYDNVIKFLRLVSAPEGINISIRNISLSTCGIPDKMRELANTGLKVNLTVSLHAPDNETRSKIMPVNKAYPVEEVISAARYYFEKTGRRVIVEYALIDGVNDSIAQAQALYKLLRGFPCHINLIKLNYVKEKRLKGSSRVKEFMEELTKLNASVTLRRSMGSDIDGACGQLRRRYLEER